MVVMVVMIAAVGAFACICIQLLGGVYQEGVKRNKQRSKVKVHQKITRYRRVA